MKTACHPTSRTAPTCMRAPTGHATPSPTTATLDSLTAPQASREPPPPPRRRFTSMTATMDGTTTAHNTTGGHSIPGYYARRKPICSSTAATNASSTEATPGRTSWRNLISTSIPVPKAQTDISNRPTSHLWTDMSPHAHSTISFPPPIPPIHPHGTSNGKQARSSQTPSPSPKDNRWFRLKGACIKMKLYPNSIPTIGRPYFQRCGLRFGDTKPYYALHFYRCGEMAEWPKATVSKTVVGFRPPRVRIPVSPPFFCTHLNL